MLIDKEVFDKLDPYYNDESMQLFDDVPEDIMALAKEIDDFSVENCSRHFFRNFVPANELKDWDIIHQSDECND